VLSKTNKYVHQLVNLNINNPTLCDHITFPLGEQLFSNLKTKEVETNILNTVRHTFVVTDSPYRPMHDFSVQHEKFLWPKQ